MTNVGMVRKTEPTKKRNERTRLLSNPVPRRIDTPDPKAGTILRISVGIKRNRTDKIPSVVKHHERQSLARATTQNRFHVELSLSNPSGSLGTGGTTSGSSPLAFIIASTRFTNRSLASSLWSGSRMDTRE